MIEVVAAIIYNSSEEILIARKKEGKSLAGLWEFPGGKIEEGESPEESLKRELLEEMDLQIEIKKYFDTNIHDYGEIRIKLIAYTAKIIAGEMKLKDHDQVRWVEVHNLKNYTFAPADIPFVERLIEEDKPNPKPSNLL